MFKSSQERLFAILYPRFKYEFVKLDYTTDAVYIPDFFIGFRGNTPVFVELKEYLAYEDVKKYRDIVISRKDIELWFIIERCDKKTLTRLEQFAARVSVGKLLIPDEWMEDIRSC